MTPLRHCPSPSPLLCRWSRGGSGTPCASLKGPYLLSVHLNSTHTLISRAGIDCDGDRLREVARITPAHAVVYGRRSPECRAVNGFAGSHPLRGIALSASVSASYLGMRWLPAWLAMPIVLPFDLTVGTTFPSERVLARSSGVIAMMHAVRVCAILISMMAVAQPPSGRRQAPAGIVSGGVAGRYTQFSFVRFSRGFLATCLWA